MDPIIRRPGRGGGSGTKTKSEKLESEKKRNILTRRARRVDTEGHGGEALEKM
jgi:hypothetical protein